MATSLMLAFRKTGMSAIACSRFFVRTHSAAVVLPPNLELPDLSVLEPPKPSIIDPLGYLFPQKMISTSVPVRKFLDPSSSIEEEVSLDPRVFNVPIRQDIIHQIVRYQRAKIRQPQSSKRTGDIRGSTRKLYQQKGTGRHRVGQSRKPGRRGGPKAHGPVIRDFSFDLNRKMRAMGTMIAMAAKYREGNMISHKTKDLTQLLEQHGTLASMTLYIDDVEDQNFSLASRNLQFVKFLPQHHANVYDIVRREKVVISKAGLKALQERLVSQRYYLGKKKSVLNQLEEYERLKLLGTTLPVEDVPLKNDVSKE